MRYDATNRLRAAATATFLILAATVARGDQFVMEDYPVPAGSRPHDVAPAPDGRVWYTAQNAGRWAGSNRTRDRRIIFHLAPARGHTE